VLGWTVADGPPLVFSKTEALSSSGVIIRHLGFLLAIRPVFYYFYSITRSEDKRREKGFSPIPAPPFPLSERIGNAEQKVEKRTG
jgi:hypothetical protein